MFFRMVCQFPFEHTKYALGICSKLLICSLMLPFQFYHFRFRAICAEFTGETGSCIGSDNEMTGVFCPFCTAVSSG